MLQSRTRWVVAKSNKEKEEQLVQQLDITPLVASLLVNRGIDQVNSARNFLYDDDQSFYDPYLLKDMQKVVNRINQAIENKEKILIFGDYDADGVTSTSVMLKTLQDLGADVHFYIPNRFTEGYGPNKNAFLWAHDNGVKLVITVDTGISAVQEAEYAKELDFDLIITDHHEVGPILPDAYAIIHPKISPDYPFKELAGVGVAFKVASALYGKVPTHLLDLVAIGTIADLVPLKDENRLLAKKGLNQLRITSNIGLKTLLKSANADYTLANEETIGFIIGPRLNAVGRLDSADPAVELLMTQDEEVAQFITEEINDLNGIRQELVQQITAEAIELIETDFPIDTNEVLVIGKSGWNAGVLGIVASKLVDKYYRPVIVLSYDEEKQLAKGSARSIYGFDMFENLSKVKHLLPHFGGHPMAAGMTLHINDVPLFRESLIKQAKQRLSKDDFIPVTLLDGTFDLSQINLKSLEQMQLLAPFGSENPKPKILIEEVELSQLKKIGADKTHLKAVLKNDSYSLDGVGFNIGQLVDEISPNSKVSVIGELAINEWNNIKKPQVMIKDLKVDHWQLFDVRGMKKLEMIHPINCTQSIKWIYFREETWRKIEELQGPSSIHIQTVTQAKELDLDEGVIVLTDLPTSLEIVEALVVNKKINRIYCHFYNEKSSYFEVVPTRDDFKKVYQFFHRYNEVDLTKHQSAFLKAIGFNESTANHIIDVFIELEFLIKKDGIVYLNKGAAKKDLEQSTIYRSKNDQAKLENQFIYSTYHQLKDWFDNILC